MTAFDEVSIDFEIRPGDLGNLICLHGSLYGNENGYDMNFEMYVAKGVIEFHERHDPELDRLWLCRHSDHLVGSLLLMHREGGAAQLRYFLIRPEYRGMGLGKKLMLLYMDFLVRNKYKSSYLWTTDEQTAAASLYVRHGFVLTEERPSTAFGKPLVEQRYDLSLPPT